MVLLRERLLNQIAHPLGTRVPRATCEQQPTPLRESSGYVLAQRLLDQQRNSSRLRAILSTSLIGSYSGNGEITTGYPVAKYSRTLIAEP